MLIYLHKKQSNATIEARSSLLALNVSKCKTAQTETQNSSNKRFAFFKIESQFLLLVSKNETNNKKSNVKKNAFPWKRHFSALKVGICCCAILCHEFARFKTQFSSHFCSSFAATLNLDLASFDYCKPNKRASIRESTIRRLSELCLALNAELKHCKRRFFVVVAQQSVFIKLRRKLRLALCKRKFKVRETRNKTAHDKNATKRRGKKRLNFLLSSCKKNFAFLLLLFSFRRLKFKYQRAQF